MQCIMRPNDWKEFAEALMSDLINDKFLSRDTFDRIIVEQGMVERIPEKWEKEWRWFVHERNSIRTDLNKLYLEKVLGLKLVIHINGFLRFDPLQQANLDAIALGPLKAERSLQRPIAKHYKDVMDKNMKKHFGDPNKQREYTQEFYKLTMKYRALQEAENEFCLAILKVQQLATA